VPWMTPEEARQAVSPEFREFADRLGYTIVGFTTTIAISDEVWEQVRATPQKLKDDLAERIRSSLPPPS
jgi:hypothetical protein